MREIGGYIELEHNRGTLFHEGAVALNCGRNCLSYLAKAKKIKKLLLPRFLCDSVQKLCDREGIKTETYEIGENCLPVSVRPEEGSVLYLVNFYGQLDNDKIKEYRDSFGEIIVDNAQAYFQKPLDGVDTLYTCRKFFGVADGAFLYTDKALSEELQRDESFDRMSFLLGRFERTASEFYADYASNNGLFKNEPLKRMSALTENLLRGIDYEFVKNRRTENFAYLHEKLGKTNKLNLKIPEGAFMYPLYIENGAEIRKALQQKKIYIPTLWPYVFELCGENDREYKMAQNILPLPVDQRYNTEDMEYMTAFIEKYLK